MIANEVPQNKEISGGGKNGGTKRVGSAICQKRANRGSINIKEFICFSFMIADGKLVINISEIGWRL